MRANLFSALIEEFGVWTDERPTGTVTTVNLIAFGMHVENQLLRSRRFEIVWNGRATLHATEENSHHEYSEKESHTSESISVLCICEPRVQLVCTVVV